MKTLIMMMMFVFVQIAAADEVAQSTENRWELTLVTTQRMVDLPDRFPIRVACIERGIWVMSNLAKMEKETLLGFVCEEEDDEPTG